MERRKQCDSFQSPVKLLLNRYLSWGPGNQQPNGTYGRFDYFPGLGVFALVNDWQQNAYVLRLTNGTPPPPPPPPHTSSSPLLAGAMTPISKLAAAFPAYSPVRVLIVQHFQYRRE